ncbi:MAG: hypothetical protein MZW92_81015 [Comamonadaceae bacterium]|nr:hypothetical protein [Comamonadaceae bacterium]
MLLTPVHAGDGRLRHAPTTCFVLFLFWEATSLLSFLLVGFEHERAGAPARGAAGAAGHRRRRAGAAGRAASCWRRRWARRRSRDDRRAPAARPRRHRALTAARAAGAASARSPRAAQFPFHFWLPNAMAAPTPVSAYLHSATMVKLGVYLLARFDAGLDAWPLWQLLLQAAGSVTAAWAMVLALRERDLKRILAWSTVATLGTLVALVGHAGRAAPRSAVGALLLAHALYKAPLFFVAGNIDHGTGTRVIDRLGNLRHAMPWTAAAAALAGMSMAGHAAVLRLRRQGPRSAAPRPPASVLALAPLANTVFVSAIAGRGRRRWPRCASSGAIRASARRPRPTRAARRWCCRRCCWPDSASSSGWCRSGRRR